MANTGKEGSIGPLEGEIREEVELKPASTPAPQYIDEMTGDSGDAVRSTLNGPSSARTLLGTATIAMALTMSGPVKSDPPKQPGTCEPSVAENGDPVQEGSCVLGISLEGGGVSVQLENARIRIGHTDNEIEIDHGAVRALAGDIEPRFVVRRGEHWAEALVEKDVKLWVRKSEDDTEVAIVTEDGKTVITTSWLDPTIQSKEDEPFVVGLAPEGGNAAACSVRNLSSPDKKDGDDKAPLAMAALVAGLAMLRREMAQRR